MENLAFLVINGDDTSSDLGEAIANDDSQSLIDLSQRFNQAREAIDQQIQQLGGQIIVSNSDEAVYQLPAESVQELAEQIRQAYQDSSGKTLTVGSGETLSQAYKALIHGKSAGKDQYNPYSEDMDSEEYEETDEHPEFSDISDEESEQPEQDLDQQDENSPEQIEDEYSNEGDEWVEDDGEEMPADDMEMEDDQEFSEEDPEDDQNIPMLSEDDIHSEEMDEEQPQTHQDIHGLLSEHMGESQEMPLEEQSPEMMDEMPEEQIPIDESQPEEMDEDTQALKQKIAQTLEQFRQNKGVIEQSKQTDPAAYQATMNMLQAMIEMAKKLSIPTDDMESQSPEMEQGQPNSEGDQIQQQIQSVTGSQQNPKM